ncbi:hypothetical protein HNQ93_003273 [Hymenobacter luteus]|uniref:DUF2199 domain-containing protein n=2 Tax=Hymenobacter TaxID=89966 RepID=A0A7W9T2I7_9BACT|nr:MULTISPECIES: DUF2199 domain-containing protein [Hymenobacter]MBB4602516.1 hypothetical protein [Hymenobacter latericoloratus]MBB6060407.1 hypothetical protein [Hymenobacter luteus]
MSYQCACCGETHQGLPDIGSAAPWPMYTIPEQEREQRVRLTKDTCVIDEQEFFVRGVLEIPVHGQEQTFGFGVWVSQSEDHFRCYQKHPDANDIGPFFGWLCTEIQIFAPTLSLKTKAHFQGNGLRPWIELEPTDHPLAVAQREGISLDRAWEIVHEYLPKK